MLWKSRKTTFQHRAPGSLSQNPGKAQTVSVTEWMRQKGVGSEFFNWRRRDSQYEDFRRGWAGQNGPAFSSWKKSFLLCQPPAKNRWTQSVLPRAVLRKDRSNSHVGTRSVSLVKSPVENPLDRAQSLNASWYSLFILSADFPLAPLLP